MNKQPALVEFDLDRYLRRLRLLEDYLDGALARAAARPRPRPRGRGRCRRRGR